PCHLDASREGERLTPPGNIEHRQTLHFWFALQNMPNQPRHVVHMDELNLMIEVLLSTWQHDRQPLARRAHSGGALALSIRRSAECIHKVIVDTRSGKNMRAQDINAASSQRRATLLHHLVGFLLLNRVGQRMRAEYALFGRWPSQVWSIDRDAAG